MKAFPEAGDLWVICEGWPSWSLGGPGDVIAIVWVEPESEAAVPWHRSMRVLTSRGLLTCSLGSFSRNIRAGALKLLQEG